MSEAGSVVEKGAEGVLDVLQAGVEHPEGLMSPLLNMAGFDIFDTSVSAAEIDRMRTRVTARDIEQAAVSEYQAPPGLINGEYHKPGYFRVDLPNSEQANMRTDLAVVHLRNGDGGRTMESWADVRWNRNYAMGVERMNRLLTGGLTDEDRPIFTGAGWNVQPVSPTEFKITGGQFRLRGESPLKPEVEQFGLGVKLNTKTAGLLMPHTIEGQPYRVLDSSGVPVTSTTNLPFINGLDTWVPAIAFYAKHIYAQIPKGELLPNLSFFSLDRGFDWSDGGGVSQRVWSRFLWPVNVRTKEVMGGFVNLVRNKKTARDPEVRELVGRIVGEQLVMGNVHAGGRPTSVSVQEMLALRSGDDVMDLVWKWVRVAGRR